MATPRPFALAATAALALALSACGGSDSTSAKSASPSNTSTSASPTSSASPSTSASATPSESSAPASDSPTSTPTTASPTPSASSPAALAGHAAAGKGAATRKVVAWPDASWRVTSIDQDLCDMGMQGSSGAKSSFSVSGTGFTCGTNASNLLACQKDTKGNALCIVDYDARRAVRFRTGLTRFDPTNSSLQPLQVKLANGVVCSTVSHDQTQHYGGRSSWLWCGTNGALLLPPGDHGTGSYFDKSKPQWTAQYSVGNAAPMTVGVTKVVYAK